MYTFRHPHNAFVPTSWHIGTPQRRWARNATHEARASPVIWRWRTALAPGKDVLPFLVFFFPTTQGVPSSNVENLSKPLDWPPSMVHAWSGDELGLPRAEKESGDFCFNTPCPVSTLCLACSTRVLLLFSDPGVWRHHACRARTVLRCRLMPHNRPCFLRIPHFPTFPQAMFMVSYSPHREHRARIQRISPSSLPTTFPPFRTHSIDSLTTLERAPFSLFTFVTTTRFITYCSV